MCDSVRKTVELIRWSMSNYGDMLWLQGMSRQLQRNISLGREVAIAPLDLPQPPRPGSRLACVDMPWISIHFQCLSDAPALNAIITYRKTFDANPITLHHRTVDRGVTAANRLL